MGRSNPIHLLGGFSGGPMVKNPSANVGDAGDMGSIPGSGRSLEREMATLQYIAWRIPWTEEPGRLQSMWAKSLQSCPALYAPVDCHLPGSSVHGILQAKILERVAMSSSRGSFWPRDRASSLTSPALTGGFFTTSATWEGPRLESMASQRVRYD